MTRRFYVLTVVYLVALVVFLAVTRQASRQDVVTVFAAASLSDAVNRITDDLQRDSEVRVRVSFAASSTLARQIENGADADIFLSASEQWTAYLVERGLIEKSVVVRPLGNRLALVAHKASGDVVDIDELESRLGADGRLAVGDPDHVPAGYYARQALASHGQWERLAPRLARAENVRAALALVARNEAPLGIVYASDSRIEKRVTTVYVFATESHDPITYSFAVLRGRDSADTRAVLASLTGQQGMDTFEEFGFERR